MRQIDDLRKRADIGGDWLRVGLVSTTVLAPLLARWNELRSAKQLAEVRDNATGQLENARSLIGKARVAPLLKQMLPTPTDLEQRARQRQDGINPRPWLIGVGLGLVAAGGVAYIVARRRLLARTDDLLELARLGNEPHYTPTDQAATTTASGSQDTERASEETRAPAGGAPNATAATRDRDDRVQAPRSSATSAATARTSAPGAPAERTAPAFDEAEAADAAEHPSKAAFVGNIHTMIYHDADEEDHLPAEENRVYFGSEAEAEASGYRRDKREVAPESTPDVAEATEGPLA